MKYYLIIDDWMPPFNCFDIYDEQTFGNKKNIKKTSFGLG